MESLTRTLAVCGVRTDLSFLFSEGSHCIECVNLRLVPADSASTQYTTEKNLPVVESFPVSPYTSTNIYCSYGPRCSTPRKNRHTMPWSRPCSPHNMHSLDKHLQEESPRTDMPAVKGILTLLFCIVYAAVLFIAAAIGSRLVTSFSTSVKSTTGYKLESWESSECKKHQYVRQRTVRFGN
ncbi:uncharacterized protein LOC121372441 [Gigantopelta aegis]|uniref:uncharacterized protein LOC121372441 n=1 Tax=Gigantopelta aegis TaxID=1735272 RepID=UPI001B887A5E|nr:uncharacterized protein LOC121372441 [Gigantopelta aegis]